jgi:hypothetical protein
MRYAVHMVSDGMILSRNLVTIEGFWIDDRIY